MHNSPLDRWENCRRDEAQNARDNYGLELAVAAYYLSTICVGIGVQRVSEKVRGRRLAMTDPVTSELQRALTDSKRSAEAAAILGGAVHRLSGSDGVLLPAEVAALTHIARHYMAFRDADVEAFVAECDRVRAGAAQRPGAAVAVPDDLSRAVVDDALALVVSVCGAVNSGA